MIKKVIDGILERKARFIVKAGKRVMPMPCHLHVVPGSAIVGSGDEVYYVAAVDWTHIRMSLDRRLVLDTKMSEFRHLNPTHDPRYGK